MAVALNSNWKVLLGYFVIDHLNASERANLLKICLKILHETNAICNSITFDGVPINISMCIKLHCNFKFETAKFRPWFEHSVTNEKVFVFWDACHILKLIRNCFGTKQILITAEGAKIKWQFLTLLCEVQKREGLRCGNKLTKRHLNWQAEKMNVRLAAQLLSCSVADSLIYCEKKNIEGFSNANHTAVFCKTINNCFDILNTRNIFSNSSFGQKISMVNIDAVTEYVNEFVTYIQGLTLDNGRKVIYSERKTGFLGFIICLQNAIELFKLLFKKCNDKFKYLLTYKLSQDHLEVFFSILRSRGGFTNNPSAYQFCNAYRRLIIRHEISGSETGNCMNFEDIEILHVGSCNKKCFPDSIIESRNDDPVALSVSRLHN